MGLPLLVLTIVAHGLEIVLTAKMLRAYRDSHAHTASRFTFVALAALASTVFLPLEAAGLGGAPAAGRQVTAMRKSSSGIAGDFLVRSKRSMASSFLAKRPHFFSLPYKKSGPCEEIESRAPHIMVAASR